MVSGAPGGGTCCCDGQQSWASDAVEVDKNEGDLTGPLGLTITLGGK